MTQTRCGFVAVIGEPNAGKSTLVNRLAGGKVSIVTPKEQTTRFNIRAVCAHEKTQIVFVDTPGIFEAGKPFEQAMVRAAWAGMGDADTALLLVDAKTGLRGGIKGIIAKLKEHPKKSLSLAINKIDQVKKEELLALAQECNAHGIFQRIFMISALKGDGVDDVKAWLAEQMPEGPWLYPEDQMSDIPLRLLAAEVTREKIFLKLQQELPYAVFVETESWEEVSALPPRGRGGVSRGEGPHPALPQQARGRHPLPEGEGKVRISQAIFVQREGQKKIVIGKGGEMLKAIGTLARHELEAMLGKRVHLSLFVKVRPGWKDDRESYRMLGLEYKK